MFKTAAIFLFLIGLSSEGVLADRLVSIEVAGTQFKVSLASGRVLASAELVGAVLNLALPGRMSARARIEQVEKDPDDPDGDILLHRLLAAQSPTD